MNYDYAFTALVIIGIFSVVGQMVYSAALHKSGKPAVKLKCDSCGGYDRDWRVAKDRGGRNTWKHSCELNEASEPRIEDFAHYLRCDVHAPGLPAPEAIEVFDDGITKVWRCSSCGVYYGARSTN